MLKTSNFDFSLPRELIANYPVDLRDKSKLLSFTEKSKILDLAFSDIVSFVNSGDILVFNDTKVIKARVRGFIDKDLVEITLVKNLGDNIWQSFAKPSKKFKISSIFFVNKDFYAKVISNNQNGLINLEFLPEDKKDFFLMLKKYGSVPLPPYIKRKTTIKDSNSYQTIYAKNPFSVAAPTAGLHFSENIMQKLDQKNVKKIFITLHIGMGTFYPVRSEYIKDHIMHEEEYIISEDACKIINKAKKDGKKIISIGTTSLRALESSVNDNGELIPSKRSTNIFIYPPYKFKIVDKLVTNFHLPKSTLFMLICAFIGKKNAYDLYHHAIREKYRFYSYGDACYLCNK